MTTDAVSLQRANGAWVSGLFVKLGDLLDSERVFVVVGRGRSRRVVVHVVRITRRAPTSRRLSPVSLAIPAKLGRQTPLAMLPLRLFSCVDILSARILMGLEPQP
jgi:hypothetical protein